jgi:hypothetical protein
MGNARADKVYVWDYGETVPQEFTLAQNAQVTGIVLAYSATNKNVITIADTFAGSSAICTIDLESHLDSAGRFSGQLEPDWLHKRVITGTNGVISSDVLLGRLPLNSFTGTPSEYNIWNRYKIVVSGIYGTFEKK